MPQPTIPDPRSMMKMQIKDAHAVHRQFSLDDEINRICDSFESHYNVTNKINVKDMDEFAVLFSNDLRKRLEEGKIDIDEEMNLKELSQKLKDKLNNIYEPIHVVDDNGEDVVPPLPPLFMKLNTPRGHGNEAMQIFFNVMNRDENTPMGTIQQKKAVANLQRVLAMSQAAPEVLAKARQYTEMVEKFNQSMYNEQKPNKEQNNDDSIDTSGVSSDLLDFDE